MRTNKQPLSPKHKRTKAERETDFLFIADLYVKNRSQREIAEQLSAARNYTVSQQQITYDLKKLRKLWQDEHQGKIEHYLIEQLRKIDALENEYWQAWERSKDEFKKKQIKGHGHGKGDQKTMAMEQTLTTEERNGNPAYLQGVERCIEKRSKLLGLIVEKKEHSGAGGTPLTFNYIVPGTPGAPDED